MVRPGSNRFRPRPAGFTLVELVVSTLMMLLLSVSILAAVTHSTQAARINANSIAAKNIAQGYLERMAIDDFANVGPDKYKTIDYTATPPVYLDRALGIKCKVEFFFDGFGTINNNSNSTIVDDAKPHWAKDQWVGDTVFIIDGPARGLFATIKSSGPNQLHLEPSLAVHPEKDSHYIINNGKRVRVTTTWAYRGRTYSQWVETMIVNYRNSGNYGF